MTRLIIILSILVQSCGPNVIQYGCGIKGNKITCSNGETLEVINQYDVSEIIDPCGPSFTGYDEVILRLSNNQLLAHYSSGALQFFTVLKPGSYVTTDSQACHFTVTNNYTLEF